MINAKNGLIAKGPHDTFRFVNAGTLSSVVEFEAEYLAFKIMAMAANNMVNLPVGATLTLRGASNDDPVVQIPIFVQGVALPAITPAQLSFIWTVEFPVGMKRLQLLSSIAATGNIAILIVPYSRVAS